MRFYRDAAAIVTLSTFACIGMLCLCRADGRPLRAVVRKHGVEAAVGAGSPGMPRNTQLEGKTALGFRPSPVSKARNMPVAHLPLDTDSERCVKSIGADTARCPGPGRVWNGAPWEIPYVVVPGSRRRVPVVFDHANEADFGLYPLPTDAPGEGDPQNAEGIGT
ncbi:MAG: hypothetical protein ACK47B_09000 [Armatimonadota bacterium]